MAKKYKRKTNRANRIMTVACIFMLIALAATIFFGEKRIKDRENQIWNLGTGISSAWSGIS